jgi:hypothetical protein
VFGLGGRPPSAHRGSFAHTPATALPQSMTAVSSPWDGPETPGDGAAGRGPASALPCEDPRWSRGVEKTKSPFKARARVPFAPAAAGSAGGDAGKAKRRPDGRVWGRSGRGQGRCDGVVGGRPEPPGSPEVSARQEGAPGSRGQRLVRAETGPPWALIAGLGGGKSPFAHADEPQRCPIAGASRRPR